MFTSPTLTVTIGQPINVFPFSFFQDNAGETGTTYVQDMYVQESESLGLEVVNTGGNVYPGGTISGEFFAQTVPAGFM